MVHTVGILARKGAKGGQTWREADATFRACRSAGGACWGCHAPGKLLGCRANLHAHATAHADGYPMPDLHANADILANTNGDRDDHSDTNSNTITHTAAVAG